MAKGHDRGLVLIAVFKLVKATMLVVAGVLALTLVRHDPPTEIEIWADTLRIDPGGRFVQHAIAKVAGLTNGKIEALGVVTFLYAAVFLVEGGGLLAKKRWAEWLTLFVTASFVPIELYEIARHPTPLRVATLVLNLVVLAYLAARRWHEHTQRGRGRPAPVPIPRR